MDRTQSLRFIADHLLQHSEPYVSSLNEAEYGPNCHMFHFGHWDERNEVGLIFVNKNGNFFRLIRQNTGRWKLFKTWNGLFETQPWMETGLSRDNPLDVIKLATSITTVKRLALLPREAIGRGQPRKAVCGGDLFTAHMTQAANTFQLTARNSMQQTFHGKLWESADAYAWCLTHAGGPGSNNSPNAQHDAVTVTYDEELLVPLAAHIPQFESQEDHPLWGQF